MEKYGTIPPKFSKKWWEYFWDYYKMHTIVTIVAIILIVTTVVQCVNQPEYDLEFMYVDASILEDEVLIKLDETVGANIDDITGDGEKQIYIMSIPIVPTEPEGFGESDKFNIELMTKFDVELTFGERTLLLVNPGVARMMIDKVSYYGYMEDLSQFGDFGDKAIISEDGKIFGVDVTGNNVLEDAGIKTDGLYLMARRQLDGEENDEKLSKLHDNALKAAEYILSF